MHYWIVMNFKADGRSPVIPDWHLENVTIENLCSLGVGACECIFGWKRVSCAGSVDKNFGGNRTEV